ncbi:MAG TPA: hypothetical protein VKD72_31440, partial [Gemmataceae bacterium]|nr:hypothetical protein [Gemmataceae bacterium]
GVDFGNFLPPPPPPDDGPPVPPAPLPGQVHVPPPQILAVQFRRNRVARVRVRDAATGVVRGVLTPFPGFRGRLSLLLLDVNGDGSADLVVRAVINGRRKKRVFDATTLAPLPAGLA